MPILYFLQDIRNGFLDAVFSVITLCGEETVFMAVGMIVFWCVDKFQGYYLLITGFIGTVVNQFLKMLFRIPRPWIIDPNFEIVESAREAASGYSFPSGHTQSSVGLFGGLARWNKNRIVRIVAISLCVLVPISRMYLGVHTPADVFTSVALALVMVFVFYPLFKRAENSPRTMYALLGALSALIVLVSCFMFLYDFPADCYTEQNIHNIESARKNCATLLGCACGIWVVYICDLKFIRFETKATIWVQLIKAVGGLVLVLLVKELLRAPLDALFGGSLVARGVRYFLMVIVGGVAWPACFGHLAKLGGKKKQTNAAE